MFSRCPEEFRDYPVSTNVKIYELVNVLTNEDFQTLLVGKFCWWNYILFNGCHVLVLSLSLYRRAHLADSEVGRPAT